MSQSATQTRSKEDDHSLVDYPAVFTSEQVDVLKSLNIHFINWRGFTLAVGPGMTTKWFDQILYKAAKRMSIIIAVTGPPGEGKTWMGMRLSEIFDKNFNVRKQVCFTRAHLARIIADEIHLNAGQAILIDEAHIAAGARHWTEELQKELVDQVAAIRSRGFIVIVVVLHVSMIDKILREFVITYQMHMEDRGMASVYERVLPRFQPKVYHPRVGSIALGIPFQEDCGSSTCLWCKYKEVCECQRAVYEREKRKFINASSRSTLEKTKQIAAGALPLDEIVEIIYKHRDMLRYTEKKTIHPESIELLLESQGISVSHSAANRLARRTEWKYPHLRPED